MKHAGFVPLAVGLFLLAACGGNATQVAKAAPKPSPTVDAMTAFCSDLRTFYLGVQELKAPSLAALAAQAFDQAEARLRRDATAFEREGQSQLHILVNALAATAGSLRDNVAIGDRTAVLVTADVATGTINRIASTGLVCPSPS